MPEKKKSSESKMKSNECSCCPYGFHIDRDFVRYCDSLYNSARLDKLRQNRREKRREKRSVESYLGLGSFSTVESANQISRNAPVHKVDVSDEAYLQSESLKDAVMDFEDTWEKSLRRSCSYNNTEKRNGFRPLKINSPEFHKTYDYTVTVEKKELPFFQVPVVQSRSNSLSSVSSHSTVLSGTGISDTLYGSLVSDQDISAHTMSLPHIQSQRTVGIHRSVLTSIREQMASSLQRMKQLEEQVKSIPALHVELTALNEEKKMLLKQLKVQEKFTHTSSVFQDLAEHLKKLENEGIMSPTLSKKCLTTRSLEALSSPALASTLDANMMKKCFIEKEILPHLKMDVSKIVKCKNTRNASTSCSILTRDIGIGHVPNKFRTVAVGDDVPYNDGFHYIKKRTFVKSTSISSESSESDLELPNFVEHKVSSSLKSPKTFVSTYSNTDDCLKSFTDSATNTELPLTGNISNFSLNFSESDRENQHKKLFVNKSTAFSPVVRSRYVQATEKKSVWHVGVQTYPVKDIKDNSSLKHANTVNIGVGEFDVNIPCTNYQTVKKSVAVGDYSVKVISCYKCNTDLETHSFKSNLLHTYCDTCASQMKSVGVGDFDINTFCQECHRKAVSFQKKVDLCSVGTNTSSDISVFGPIIKDIHICDKCNATIQSLAEDFAAATVTSKSSKVNESSSPSKELKQKKSVSSRISENKISKVSEESSCTTNNISFTEAKRHSDIQSLNRLNSEEHELSKGEDVIRTVEDESSAEEHSVASEVLPDFTNLPVISRKKVQLSKELRAACKVLNDYLQKPERSSEKKPLSCLKIIQNEWFAVANQKNADPLLIEDYLDAFEEFSRQLLNHIVNMPDCNGNTALHYAVSYGNFDVVSILIDSKVCDVNKKNKAGYTSIMLVALAEMKNDTHHYVVQRLFSIGDINMKATQNGQTALMLAVSHGKRDIVKILLDVGAEINLQDKDGSTALMCAAEHGHLDIVKLLLSHSECDPTILDNDGCNALTIAMEAGHKDIGLLIYTNMNFSRGNSPYSTLKGRMRSTPRSTPPPRTPTLRTPPLPSPSSRSSTSISSFQFPN